MEIVAVACAAPRLPVSVMSTLPVVCLFAAATSSTTSTPAPCSSADMPIMLSIDWRRLPDLGRGFQNSDGGWVSADEVVTAFGHGPALPHDPSSAFLNSASLLNVTAAAGTQCRGRGFGFRNERTLP